MLPLLSPILHGTMVAPTNQAPTKSIGRDYLIVIQCTSNVHLTEAQQEEIGRTLPLLPAALCYCSTSSVKPNIYQPGIHNRLTLPKNDRICIY
mmetsp:Transcript_5720/g.13483  ORF Transcript_5720/g.13483 Transcript_5720/m.13483 type:complete len:93 (+) Transcript_5720:939-1217(+)